MITTIKKIIPADTRRKLRAINIQNLKSTKNHLFEESRELWAKSYSQEGEDMLLRSILFRKERGFYVDIGAHHPKRFSNTMHFYESGWRGINIDAMPGSMDEFHRLRPKDINIEIGVGKPGKLKFYIYDEPAINTFDHQIVLQREKEGIPFKIVKEKSISVMTLEKVLDKYLPKGRKIDFITIDVEGKDLEVLESNNWSKYSPGILLVECFGRDIQQIASEPVYSFLKKLGYRPLAKTKNTVIFENTKR